jgi:hypothetical protein
VPPQLVVATRAPSGLKEAPASLLVAPAGKTRNGRVGWPTRQILATPSTSAVTIRRWSGL